MVQGQRRQQCRHSKLIGHTCTICDIDWCECASCNRWVLRRLTRRIVKFVEDACPFCLNGGEPVLLPFVAPAPILRICCPGEN